MTTTKHRSGADILVEQLRIHQTERVFCVPGESYLAVLDALYDRPGIDVISCRHEGGAAMMADAYGKLTGRPGICMVTRGPGATNASAGLHVAMQDATPMIVFIGQVARHMTEREAFQELDYRRAFGQLAKWVAEIDDARRIPEMLSRAYYTATTGRPGPVVLSLPEDMLTDQVETLDAQPYAPIEVQVHPEQIEALAAQLQHAARPLVIVGGSGWRPESVAAMTQFATRNGLPVAASFRRQDRFDNRHDHYVGDVGIGINPPLAARIRQSDLILAIGARLGEMASSGYTLLDIPTPRQRLIHVHPDPNELGRVYQPTMGIAASVSALAGALAGLDLPAEKVAQWRPWTAQARADYLAALEPVRSPGPLQMSDIMRWLNDTLPTNAIITNGAGNFSTWVHRYFQYKQLGTQLAPTSGSMGYGVPAAVAAKLTHPDRLVVCVAGDGDFLMTGQELATAAQYGANIIVLIVNNGMYGTIRMHQERHYPGRTVGTDLVNPDFVTLATAYGAHAERIEDTASFYDAFERCRQAGRPAVLELCIDPDAITIRQSLSDIRAAAQTTV